MTTADRATALLTESVTRQLQALSLLLGHWMRPTIPGQRAIVRVGGDGYY